MVRSETRDYLLLQPCDIKGALREWIDIFYPGREGEAWLCETNKVYVNQSPIRMLSVWHDAPGDVLFQNVRRIVEGFHDVLSYVSVPYAASADAVYADVVEAQKAVYERTFGPSEAQRASRVLPLETPLKLFHRGRAFSDGSSEIFRPAA